MQMPAISCRLQYMHRKMPHSICKQRYDPFLACVFMCARLRYTHASQRNPPYAADNRITVLFSVVFGSIRL